MVDSAGPELNDATPSSLHYRWIKEVYHLRPHDDKLAKLVQSDQQLDRRPHYRSRAERESEQRESSRQGEFHMTPSALLITESGS